MLSADVCLLHERNGITNSHRKGLLMSPMPTQNRSAKVRAYRARAIEIFTRGRWSPAWLLGFLILAASPLRAQSDLTTFTPTFSVGGGIQTSYQHIEPTGATGVDNFALDHARLYFNGDVTKDISVMFNTDYNNVTDTMEILDAVGQFHISPKVNVWFGR